MKIIIDQNNAIKYIEDLLKNLNSPQTGDLSKSVVESRKSDSAKLVAWLKKINYFLLHPEALKTEELPVGIRLDDKDSVDWQEGEPDLSLTDLLSTVLDHIFGNGTSFTNHMMFFKFGIIPFYYEKELKEIATSILDIEQQYLKPFFIQNFSSTEFDQAKISRIKNLSNNLKIYNTGRLRFLEPNSFEALTKHEQNAAIDRLLDSNKTENFSELIEQIYNIMVSSKSLPELEDFVGKLKKVAEYQKNYDLNVTLQQRHENWAGKVRAVSQRSANLSLRDSLVDLLRFSLKPDEASSLLDQRFILNDQYFPTASMVSRAQEGDYLEAYIKQCNEHLNSNDQAEASINNLKISLQQNITPFFSNASPALLPELTQYFINNFLIPLYGEKTSPLSTYLVSDTIISNYFFSQLVKPDGRLKLENITLCQTAVQEWQAYNHAVMPIIANNALASSAKQFQLEQLKKITASLNDLSTLARQADSDDRKQSISQQANKIEIALLLIRQSCMQTKTSDTYLLEIPAMDLPAMDYLLNVWTAHKAFLTFIFEHASPEYLQMLFTSFIGQKVNPQRWVGERLQENKLNDFVATTASSTSSSSSLFVPSNELNITGQLYAALMSKDLAALKQLARIYSDNPKSELQLSALMATYHAAVINFEASTHLNNKQRLVFKDSKIQADKILNGYQALWRGANLEFAQAKTEDAHLPYDQKIKFSVVHVESRKLANCILLLLIRDCFVREHELSQEKFVPCLKIIDDISGDPISWFEEQVQSHPYLQKLDQTELGQIAQFKETCLVPLSRQMKAMQRGESVDLAGSSVTLFPALREKFAPEPLAIAKAQARVGISRL